LRSFSAAALPHTITTAGVAGSLILDERVGQPDFDECLPGHAETTGLLIDLAQEVYREVYIHALDSAAGAGTEASHKRGDHRGHEFARAYAPASGRPLIKVDSI
jgi:hypothetical protein